MKGTHFEGEQTCCKFMVILFGLLSYSDPSNRWILKVVVQSITAQKSELVEVPTLGGKRCLPLTKEKCEHQLIYLRTKGCFLKWWYPHIIHFNWVFHYKPSILGYHHFRKHIAFVKKLRKGSYAIRRFIRWVVWNFDISLSWWMDTSYTFTPGVVVSSPFLTQHMLFGCVILKLPCFVRNSWDLLDQHQPISHGALCQIGALDSWLGGQIRIVSQFIYTTWKLPSGKLT